MTIETIDNVLYYVWRAGDELPKYQPIDLAKRVYGQTGLWTSDRPLNTWSIKQPYEDGTGYEFLWPKLLNDRAQHQRMIDEAFENELPVHSIEHELNVLGAELDHSSFIGMESKELAKCQLQTMARICAKVKRMMEYVQEQIDKEESK